MFYLKLALTNIKKNGKIYFPYLITSIFTVMMFYCVKFLGGDNGLRKDSETAAMVMNLGVYVVIIFSVIFLLYINSFLMKNRKKELGLYNILGMEKRHVMLIIFIETLIVYLISLGFGVLTGVLFSKLMMLILVKIMAIHTSIVFSIDMNAILITTILFSVIFFVSFMINAASIRFSNPIQLLKGGQVGEKEPKTKWLMTLVGVITLGAGYTIAQTIEDPITALVLFFVAVVLVIIGTYALFTAGSIVILKILKKNKKYYYQTNHFISVSQMMYRMKQNAVGLASICILCTCILVMISSTFTLYSGVFDTAKKSVRADYSYKVGDIEKVNMDEEIIQLEKNIKTSLASKNIGISRMASLKYCHVLASQNGTVFTAPGEGGSNKLLTILGMTLSDYNRIYNHHVTLKDHEVLYNSNYHFNHDSMMLNNQLYSLKMVKSDPWFVKDDIANVDSDSITFVFKDDAALKQALTFEHRSVPSYVHEVLVDYKGGYFNSKAEKVMRKTTQSFISKVSEKNDGEISYSNMTRYENYQVFSQMYGSLLFLGIFLGVLFMMAAILIMYYKQLSEGYEDQKRYEILQNVGLSKKEVRQAVSSQVLIFFFLPLVVAVIHLFMAYNMILKMFKVLIYNAPQTFITCTVVSVIVLAICYTIVYFCTSRTYYKIVKK
ncbi:ABC transporter permease [uncultured Catenibacterium sp.]|uniref:ABC transporter permease n=1 Tax=uncultured Catenibacterium sp. TaxID=286142 RepID=UPI00262F5FFD|nr:ABC transporter permease [uncultured Catenibacterium sp.]